MRNLVQAFLFLIIPFAGFSQPTEALDHYALQVDATPVIDGIASEAFWENQPWYGIDHLYVDQISGNENTKPDSADFYGRFKVGWEGNTVYILAEITDDILDYDQYNPNDDPNQVFEFDVLEIFIDEDNSGGDHTKTHNAFAYHLSPDGVNVADQCGCGVSNDWKGRLFNDNLDYAIEIDGNKYTWEVAMRVYNDNFIDDAADNSPNLVDLDSGKTMGFGVAYVDYDNTGNRHMMGSFFTPGSTNNARNIGWKDASSFGKIKLWEEFVPVFDVNEQDVAVPQGFSDEVIINIQPLFTNENTSYEITPEPDFFNWSIEEDILTITEKGDAYGSGNFELLASNNGTTYSQNIAMEVRANPSFTLVGETKLNEDFGTSSITVSEDFPDQDITYTLAPEEVDFMSISFDTNSGELTLESIEGQSGESLFTLTASNGLGSWERQFNLIVENTVQDITGLNPGSEINIYPNPARNKIHFSTQPLNYTLYNLQGEIILEGHGREISIKELPGGIYLLEIASNFYRVMLE